MSIGWDSLLFEQVLDQLHAIARDSGSAQFKLVQGGDVLISIDDDSEPQEVYDVQQGVLSILIGMAEERYLLEVIDNINHHLDPEWTQLSPWDEAKLTIEILLRMTTGMDDELNPLGTIGETWRHNNTAYNYLKKILCLQTGQTLDVLSHEWLFAELSMTQTHWIDGDDRLPDGTPISSLVSTASDLVRLGQLLLDRGHLGARRLLPAHYLEQMKSPGSAENPAWGFGWWNNQRHASPGGQVLPVIASAPPDLIAARGEFGNYLHVVPGLDLIMARTANAGTAKQIDIEMQIWQLLMPAGSD